MSKAFSEFLSSAGIQHQTTTSYTPQQNGVAERMNRTLIEKAKCLLKDASLPHQFWGEAIKTAEYVYNRSLSSSTSSISISEEMLSGVRLKLDHLRVFGCRVMVLKNIKKNKFDNNAVQMTFVGYDTNKKAYRCYDHSSNKIFSSRDVKFHEDRR